MALYRYVSNKNPVDGTNYIRFRSVTDSEVYEVKRGDTIDLSNEDLVILRSFYNFATSDGTPVSPVDAGADGDPRMRRKVRGINYVSKTGIAPSADFNRDEWDLDKKYIPRFGDSFLSGHSWTQFAPTPGALWYRRLTRALGIPDEKAINIGVSGGTSFGPKGGFPSDGASSHTSKDYTVSTQDLLVGAGGYSATADNWEPWSSLLLPLIGFNDPGIAAYFGALDWEPLTREALRTLFVHMRASRRYTPQSAELTYTGDWFQAGDPMSMGEGLAFLPPNSLGYVSFHLPLDYKGGPIGLHWGMNSNAATYWFQNVYVASDVVVSQYNTFDYHVVRAYASPPNGSNPGGGVQLPGVLRLTNLTAADAGKLITIEIATTGGYGSFAGVTFETDAPIMALQIPRLPTEIGQSEEANDRQVGRVNQITREVIDEFPAGSIAFAEFPTLNDVNGSVGNFNGIADPHLCGKGNAAYARYVYDNLCAAEISSPDRAFTAANVL